MKKLVNVLVLTLAINFLAVAGAVAYLKVQGRLDRGKIHAIRDVLFPPPATQPAAPEPKPDATTQPVLRLEELLARETGRSTTEQVEFIRQSFDAQMAQLDRRQRELTDLQRQVEMAKQQLARDRAALNQEQKALETREQQAARLAKDKGFQDCLALYRTMPGKQVKTIFLTLDEQLVGQYVQALEPRSAAKIIREFKTPEETQFIQRVLELVRQAQPPTTAPQSPAPAAPPPPPPPTSENVNASEAGKPMESR